MGGREAGDRELRRTPGARARPRWAPAAVWLLFRVVWRVRVHAAERVPAQGAVLLASNHLGLLDGPMLVGVAPRWPQCLVKQEMFRGPIGVLLRAVGQIPVDRGRGDRAALQRALSVLAAGGVVGVFPEGTRGRGDVGEVRQGIAWLALRSRAPVVPVACLGTRRTGEPTSRLPGLRRRIDVVFGAPVELSARAGVPGRVALAEASAALQERMAAHVNEALRCTGQVLPEDLGEPLDGASRGEPR